MPHFNQTAKNVESKHSNSFTPLSQAKLSLYQFSQELTLAGQHFINNCCTACHENHTQFSRWC